jgi:hypothetical protein
MDIRWQTKPAVLFNQSEQNMSDKFLLFFYKKKMSRFVASAAKFSEKLADISCLVLPTLL